MFKFFKTNWPLLLLGLIAILIMGKIMSIRRTEIPKIKKLEREEKNRLRSVSQAPLNQEQNNEAVQAP